ncbi:MAG: hypothetical protein F6K10_08570 [Moorea sp. SIO2B7]|nr:hypothetical protein [Moorena sp. SIO2B7]
MTKSEEPMFFNKNVWSALPIPWGKLYNRLKIMALHHCGMIGKFLLGFKSNLIPAIAFSENNKI